MSGSASQPVYKIFCIIAGDDTPFSVKIESDETVDDLKDKIKGKNANQLASIDAKNLKLYQVNVVIDDNMIQNVNQTMLKGPSPLGPAKELSELYEATPPKGTVHILVQVPTIVSLKRDRSWSDSESRDAKRIKLLESIPSVMPSSIQQKDLRPFRDKVTYNRPNAELATIPIALSHEVFSNLLHDCQHCQPTREDNKWLADLRHEMLKEYPSDAERCQEFRGIFYQHTSIWLQESSIPGHNTRTDGHYAVDDNVILLTGGKNEWIRLNADPQLQKFIYYIQYTQDKVKNGANKRSKFPCLIIYYIGSLIGFAGAVVASKAQFEPLTSLFDLAVNEHDKLAIQPLARALGALRAALEFLKGYYQDLSPSRPLPKPCFPFRNYYMCPNNSQVEFDYQRRLSSKKLLFLGTTRGEKKSLLLKFTQRYSKEAHEYCASLKIAPELYSVEELGGGWLMVAMEYLDEDTYVALPSSRTSKDAVLEGVKTAVFRLHAGDFVHGDIRNINVMVRTEWETSKDAGNVKLIDFDWAGRDGVTRYPANAGGSDRWAVHQERTR